MSIETNEEKELLTYLSQFATENKKNLFASVLANRTRYLTVVLEDVYQGHNASAVLRSCDCFGIQDIHIVEKRNNFNINTDVALGATQWLDLHTYNESEQNTIDCITKLKQQGYQIVATTPHKNDFSINELPLDKPIALFFGTERLGLSEVALNNADQFVQIPMYGFSESFNISVSAAICLKVLTDRLHESNIKWQLSEEDHLRLNLKWMKHILKKPELLEKEFYRLKNLV